MEHDSSYTLSKRKTYVESKKFHPKMIKRANKSYQKHASIDFQSFQSEIWRESQTWNRDADDRLRNWALYAIVGVMAGFTAFIIDILVDNLVLWKWSTAQMIIQH